MTAGDGGAMTNSIEDFLRGVLVEHLFVELERDKILSTHSLRHDLGLDSVGFVELRTQVEKRFSVAISEDDFTPENFSTISSLKGLIDRLSR
jgi:acyl carrier protein